MKNLLFEWDDEKERININKHKIDFSTAAHIFYDDNRLEMFDYKHSENEDRYKVIGSINGYTLVIVVIYTTRENGKTIRIISARKAEKEERKKYYGDC